MNNKYRVRLQAEDGDYVVDDGFATWAEAERWADQIAENYGDGQEVYVEEYVDYW